MGSLQATEMANALPMEQALEWHLRANHFPPVPSSMVKPCLEAIQAFWEEDLDRMIGLPEGVGYKGLTAAPAHAILDQHHLDAWCLEEEIDDE